LVNPELPDTRRNAFFLALRQRDPEFRALEELIKAEGVGTISQKSDMIRFIEAQKVFMDNFPRLAPSLTLLQRILQKIANQLGLPPLVNSFEDFSKGVNNMPQAIASAIPRNFLNFLSDVIARDVTNKLDSIGTDRGSLLPFLPFVYKVQLIDDMLKGLTVHDEDEQAIYRILKTSKSRFRAEFCQLVCGVGWEELDYNFDGQEYKYLEALFSL
jgi:cell fate (sporulation/competence/biofilm development) regulator YmcA (YheA/YmcA/DUF963 family)